MSPTSLLRLLRTVGVELSIAGSDLRCRAPRGVLTPELAAQVRTHKAALMTLLAPAQADESDPHDGQAQPPPASPIVPWWPDTVPKDSAPIRHLPPHQCLGPIVCSRIGPCARHSAGEPCEVSA